MATALHKATKIERQ